MPYVKLAGFNRILLIPGHVLPFQEGNPHLQRLPEKGLPEDPDLLMCYDNASLL